MTALDPETGLFPETYVEPFIRSEALHDLGRQVIADFDEFEAIQTAMREADLDIVWVFETKPFDQTSEEFKPHTIAKVTKASPLWRCLTGTPLVIQFRQTFWDLFDEPKRRAVIHHELTHIMVDEPDDQGRVKITLRPHDVEDFALTMRRFGPIIPGRATFVKAFLDWQHEQDRPAPTPLRLAQELADAAIADPEERARTHRIIDENAAAAFTDEVLDRVADEVNAGALDDPTTGTTVTVTRRPRKPSGD